MAYTTNIDYYYVSGVVERNAWERRSHIRN